MGFQINFVFIRVRSLQAKWMLKRMILLVWAHVTLNTVWKYTRATSTMCVATQTEYSLWMRCNTLHSQTSPFCWFYFTLSIQHSLSVSLCRLTFSAEKHMPHTKFCWKHAPANNVIHRSVQRVNDCIMHKRESELWCLCVCGVCVMGDKLYFQLEKERERNRREQKEWNKRFGGATLWNAQHATKT